MATNRFSIPLLIQQVFPTTLMMVLVVLPGTACPPPAWAETWLFNNVDKGVFSIGGRATYLDPTGGNGNWFGGTQVRWYALRFFAVEGSADYRTTDFASSNRTDYYPVQVSGLFYLLPGKRLSPFLLGGVGWYYSHVARDGAPDSTKTRFGPHVGGGLQLMLTENFSIDGSYRYIWLNNQSASDNRIFGPQFGNDNHMVTIGLNIHF